MISQLSSNITGAFARIINTKKRSNREYESRLSELIANIEDTKSEIKRAMDNFNNVTEPKLIDFYIYKIQSEQTRFEYLISEYKTLYPLLSVTEDR